MNGRSPVAVTALAVLWILAVFGAYFTLNAREIWPKLQDLIR